MIRVRLIHWKPDEASARVRDLRDRGLEVDFEPFGMDTLKRIGEDPPGAVIVDLTRIPSQGRDIGVALRKRRSTRNISLIFAGGAEEKVGPVRALLPDAEFTSWENIGKALARIGRKKSRPPVVPSSTFAAYAGRPLASKLGITKGKTILIGAPKDFEAALGELPEGIALSRRAAGKGHVVMLFADSMSDLEKRFDRARSLIGEGGSMWIAWRKKSSGMGSDLTQASVRRFGLDSGLVDYKVCSIDDVWSGLRFAVRDK
jgi:hypothetical protein